MPLPPDEWNMQKVYPVSPHTSNPYWNKNLSNRKLLPAVANCLVTYLSQFKKKCKFDEWLLASSGHQLCVIHPDLQRTHQRVSPTPAFYGLERIASRNILCSLDHPCRSNLDLQVTFCISAPMVCSESKDGTVNMC